MTGFEPRSSGVGSNLSANFTTAPILVLFIFKYGPNPASFCLFSSFPQCNDKYSTKFGYTTIDGVLGIQTQD